MYGSAINSIDSFPNSYLTQKKTTTTPKCQKCLKEGHWTYQCKNEAVYLTRPSHTDILKNPNLKISRPATLDDVPEIPRITDWDYNRDPVLVEQRLKAQNEKNAKKRKRQLDLKTTKKQQPNSDNNAEHDASQSDDIKSSKKSSSGSDSDSSSSASSKAGQKRKCASSSSSSSSVSSSSLSSTSLLNSDMDSGFYSVDSSLTGDSSYYSSDSGDSFIVYDSLHRSPVCTSKSKKDQRELKPNKRGKRPRNPLKTRPKSLIPDSHSKSHLKHSLSPFVRKEVNFIQSFKNSHKSKSTRWSSLSR